MNDPHSTPHPAHAPGAMQPRPVSTIQSNHPAALQPRPVAKVPPPVPPLRSPAPPARIAPPSDEPLALVDDLDDFTVQSATPTASKIKFGPDVAHKTHDWKRTPIKTGQGACRVKSFHAKYSDQGIEHIDDAINVWLDDHPEVEVKFVTTTVHVFEGKIREPAIVMNVWY